MILRLFLLLVGLLIILPVQAKEDCTKRFCIKGMPGEVEYLKSQIGEKSPEIINTIISEKESQNIPFDSITLEFVMYDVFLLSMQKPDYYGSKVLLLKQGDNWSVLHESDAIY
ncbi:hypothetical protein [Arenicella xantha]|uniref:Uncharacterized protein n=1 Tax=Arenicella xantha TaxID=644221 RepID=A0A395JHL1_9GAMM|nr:hypothetical protein [Arenicella xantha]RBP47005.1 hypothetical protein DFR28_1158 [Arenicella xantha]